MTETDKEGERQRKKERKRERTKERKRMKETQKEKRDFVSETPNPVYFLVEREKDLE